MISSGWSLGLEVAFVITLLTAIIQRVWPMPDPSAKRITYLERRVSELSTRLGAEEALLSDVQELIAQGRKINAIKLYREQTGASLAASKNAVDEMKAQTKAQELV